MLSLIQNLRIGTKLAIASAFGILLVLALNTSQLIGNGNVRRSSEAAVGQQQLAREAVEARLAVRSMQLAVRDIRLANNSGELQKAGDALIERSGTVSRVAEEMLKLSRAPENRARIEKTRKSRRELPQGSPAGRSRSAARPSPRRGRMLRVLPS